MKKYIPFLYIPLMLFIIVKLNVEIDQGIKYMTLGFARLGALRYGIVFSEVVFYILLKRFHTPRILVIIVLGILAFPQPLWIISNLFIGLFSPEYVYLLEGPYTFVGMTLLSIEIIDILNKKIRNGDR